jgi:pimeloyl-ACP methyl ester carboxylesterase
MDRDWPEDAIAAEFCRLSYFRFEEDAEQANLVTRAAAAIGYGEMEFFNAVAPGKTEPGAQAIAALDERGHAIIAFRGTQPDSHSDLLADARFLPVAWSGPGRVHRGFWSALECVLPAIESWLAERQGSRLTLTGHSLGAAMATLLAALRPQAELVTIGCPRVGNAEFGGVFEGRQARRYVGTVDLVTRVPPELLGYAHVGEEHYIDASGRVHRPAPDGLSRSLDQAKARFDFMRLAFRAGSVPAPGRDFADHAPINYVSAILGVRS